MNALITSLDLTGRVSKCLQYHFYESNKVKKWLFILQVKLFATQDLPHLCEGAKRNRVMEFSSSFYFKKRYKYSILGKIFQFQQQNTYTPNGQPRHGKCTNEPQPIIESISNWLFFKLHILWLSKYQTPIIFITCNNICIIRDPQTFGVYGKIPIRDQLTAANI